MLIIWSAYDAPGFVEVEILEGVRYYTCGSRVNDEFTEVMLIIVVVFNSLVTLFAAWLALKIRKVASAFHDSTGIALSVYNFGIVAVIVLPMIYVGESFSAEAVYYIKSVAVLEVTTFGMLSLYGPKIHVIYFAKEKNVQPKDLKRDSLNMGQLHFGSSGNRVHHEHSPETSETEVLLILFYLFLLLFLYLSFLLIRLLLFLLVTSFWREARDANWGSEALEAPIRGVARPDRDHRDL